MRPSNAVHPLTALVANISNSEMTVEGFKKDISSREGSRSRKRAHQDEDQDGTESEDDSE
jgi:hypothetical protein